MTFSVQERLIRTRQREIREGSRTAEDTSNLARYFFASKIDFFHIFLGGEHSASPHHYSMGNSASFPCTKPIKNKRSRLVGDEATSNIYRKLQKALSQKVQLSSRGVREGCNLRQVEQQWVSALVALRNTSNSIDILELLLKETFPTMHKSHTLKKGIFYKEVARMMLEDALQEIEFELDLSQVEKDGGKEDTKISPRPLLCKKVLPSLPTTVWREKGCIDTCAVCHDPYSEGSVVKTLPCGHFFHSKCIDPWLNQHSSCPLCRCELPSAGDMLH